MGLNINDPLVQATLMRGGMDIAGGIFSGVGQGKMNDAQIAAQNSRDQVSALIAMLRERGNQADSQAQNQRLGFQGAAAAIGSPLDHQKSRQDMALQRALLFDGPGGGPQYSMPGSSAIRATMGNLPRFDSAKPFFSDDAMAAAESPFWQSVGGLTGGQVRPNLPGVGYQGAGAQGTQNGLDTFNNDQASQVAARNASQTAQIDQTQAAINQALGSPGSGASGAAKKGPGFWGKLGRIGLQVAPIAAAFIPGVGPLASMAIAGAAGGARGAMDGGGWKGALKGGATSAGMSYVGGKIPLGGSGAAGSARAASNATAARLARAAARVGA